MRSPGFKLADAMNDGDAQQAASACAASSTCAGDLRSVMRGIMFQRQGGRDRLAAHMAGETRHRARLAASRSASSSFGAEVEILALDADACLHVTARHRRKEGDLVAGADRRIEAGMVAD